MIQRQQSLWLALSTICAFLSFVFPFYGGADQNGSATSGGASFINAGSNLFLILLSVGSLILSSVTIFYYKDRKRQLRLCFIGIGISILLIVLYFIEAKKFPGVIALSSVFVFAIPIGYILAARGIWKDEKLVKSLDKLR